MPLHLPPDAAEFLDRHTLQHPRHIFRRRLGPLCAELTAALERFAGYDERYAAALARAEAGQLRWVDGTGVDSCHTVWIQLHEDLLSTLGIDRSTVG